jgi:hypothetical protein
VYYHRAPLERKKKKKKIKKEYTSVVKETCNFGFGMAIHFYSNICIVEMGEGA